MAKQSSDNSFMQQGALKEFLSQDIDLIVGNFTDEHAQVITETIKEHNDSVELITTFFALCDQGESSLTLVKNFITKYIENNPDFDSYENLIRFLRDIPTINKLGEEVLLFALNLAPTQEHFAYCVGNIIQAAVSTPDSYAQLEPMMNEAIETCPNILQEDLNDFFIDRNHRTDIQHYLVDRLNFSPITECPFLIDEDIEGLHPTINNILRKSRCDLVGEDKVNLIANLIEHFNILLSNGNIALILKAGSECSDIYMCAYGSGADSVETTLDKRKCMTFRGAKAYADDKNIGFVTSIVHESTHICFRKAYNNDSKPYKVGDEVSIQTIEALTTSLINILNEKTPSREILEELAYDATAGYNEFLLAKYYRKSSYSKELPAFFMQELAIRILLNNPEMRDSILLANEEAIFGIINPMLDIFLDIPENEVPVAGEFSFTDEVA